MSGVASKNLYDLLGEDGDSAPSAAPAVSASNSAARGGATRGSDRGRGGATRGGRDGEARRGGNDSPRGGRNVNDNFRGERFTARGGKGGGRERDKNPKYRGEGAVRDDRADKTGQTDTNKAIGQSWGANTGDSEWNDEQAAERIARADGKAAAKEDAVDATETVEEPEDTSMSYADYLAKQAEKETLAAAAVRKANEGVKSNKNWTDQELKRDEDQDFFSGEQKKERAPRERKEKQVIEIDQRYVEPARGGRGGGRGRGDREGRGRGDRGSRGASRGAGESRGRGGRGGASASVNVSDQSAFPSLGA